MAAHLSGTGATPGAGATGDYAQELPQSLHQECMQRKPYFRVRGYFNYSEYTIFTVHSECKE